MKRVINITIVSLMITFASLYSCSKSSDTTPTPTPTPTPNPNPTSIYPDSNYALVDNVKEEFSMGFNVPGASSWVTMNCLSTAGDKRFTLTTWTTPPSGSKTYTTKVAQSSDSSTIQVLLDVDLNGTPARYTASNGGSVIFTTSGTFTKVQFKDLTFVKAPLANKIASATLTGSY